jgi:hypothetical protein
LRPCLDLVLEAFGADIRAGRCPGLLVLAARDLNAAPLRGLVEDAGIAASGLSLPEGREALLPAALHALAETR